MEDALYEELMDDLSVVMGQPREEVTIGEVSQLNQKAISVYTDARNAHLMAVRMEREGDNRGRARIRALQQPHAGAWLTSVPNPNPNTGSYLCPQDFVVCLQYRLGAEIYPRGLVCGGCGTEMDVFGEHALNCRNGKGRVGRHNAVRDVFADVTRSANLSPRVEEGGIIPGTQQRPGDVTLPGFPVGRDTLIDVTVVNPLQQACLEEAVHQAGVAMSRAKERKRRAYQQGLRGDQIFKPVAFETLGGFDGEGEALFRKVTSILARNQGKDESEVHRFAVQRIASAIQRGNAVCFVDRIRGEVGEEGDVLY